MKKRNYNRLISLVLAVLVIVTMLPDMPVRAENVVDNSTEMTESSTEETEENVDSAEKTKEASLLDESESEDETESETDIEAVEDIDTPEEDILESVQEEQPVTDENRCGYVEPEWIDVGTIEDVSVEAFEYAARDTFYWKQFGSNYFYDGMSTAEKNLYDNLYNANMSLLAGTGNAVVTTYGNANYYYAGFSYAEGLSETDVKNVAMIFQLSNPQFYFIGDSMLFGRNSSGQFGVALCIYSDFANGSVRSEKTNQIQSKLDSWLATIRSKTSAYEMEKAAHDIVVNNTIYEQKTAKYHQSSAGVLLEGKAVCAGYAETFEMLCNAIGIQSISITSSVHEWNEVKLYGNWYIVDCTWDDQDDGNLYYNFFNLSDRKLKNYDTSGSHTPESFWSNYTIPACVNDSIVGPTIYKGINYAAVYNPDYYLYKNPDVKQKFGADTEAALAHFVDYGMNEGRCANANFDVYAYKSRYKDLRTAYGNNLKSYYMHYITSGQAEGRKATEVVNITDGVTVYNGVDYSAVYDYSYYLSKYPDVAGKYKNNDIGALEQFVKYGMSEARQGSSNFNVLSYYYQYPDLRNVYGKNNWSFYYMHYMQSGKKEGRAGTGTTSLQGGVTVYNGVDYSAVYNFKEYLSKNADLKNKFAGDDFGALAHFVTYGMKEGRKGNYSFDVNSYRSRYGDLQKAFGNNFKSYYMHYIQSGKKEGRNASVCIYNGVNYSSVFDYSYYMKYSDVKNAFGSDQDKALAHFVNYGMKEGRQGIKTFNVNVYRQKNPDLVKKYGNNISSYYYHYINYGRREGRKAY